MYSKCYTSVCDKEANRRAFLKLMTAKNQAESGLKVAKKKVQNLDAELEQVKKILRMQ